MPTWIRILFALLAILAVVMVGICFMPYSTSLLSGDARITDSGFWTYPRYSVSFPKVPLAADIQRTCKVKGLPSELFTFQLKLLDPGSDAPLLRQDWTITVCIVDDQQQEIAKVIAVPLSDWIVASSRKETCLWHTALRDLPFKTRKEYSIEISVDGAENTSATILAVPQLRGGGSELP